MSAKTNDIDYKVLNLLSEEVPLSIIKLSEAGPRVGTIRGSLERLLARGLAARHWVGNQRFGYYEYRRAGNAVRVTKRDRVTSSSGAR